jgi:hypothetical protein
MKLRIPGFGNSELRLGFKITKKQRCGNWPVSVLSEEREIISVESLRKSNLQSLHNHLSN